MKLIFELSSSKWFDPTLEEVGKETTGFNDNHIPIPDLEDRTIRYLQCGQDGLALF